MKKTSRDTSLSENKYDLVFDRAVKLQHKQTNKTKPSSVLSFKVSNLSAVSIILMNIFTANLRFMTRSKASSASSGLVFDQTVLSVGGGGKLNLQDEPFFVHDAEWERLCSSMTRIFRVSSDSFRKYVYETLYPQPYVCP